MTTWIRALALGAIFCFAFVLATPHAEASGPMNRNIGVGLSVGAPMSITGKYYLAADSAIDFHVGTYHHFNRAYGGGLFLAADYLMNIWTFVETSTLKMPFYAGIGGFGAFGNSSWNCNGRDRWCDPRDSYGFGLGARIPIGTALQFQSAPFEVFFELSPAIGVYFRRTAFGDTISRTEPHFIPAALGARFFFE